MWSVINFLKNTGRAGKTTKTKMSRHTPSTPQTWVDHKVVVQFKIVIVMISPLVHLPNLNISPQKIACIINVPIFRQIFACIIILYFLR